MFKRLFLGFHLHWHNGLVTPCAMLRLASGKRGLPTTLAPTTSGRIPLDTEQLMRPLNGVRAIVMVSTIVGIAFLVRTDFGDTTNAPTVERNNTDSIESGVLSEQAQQEFAPRQLLDQGRGTMKSPGGPHEFYFTRAIYNSGWGYGRWAIDYPKADRQFMTVVNRLIDVNGSPTENAIRLDDPEIRKYPFLYALEVGDIALSPAEIEGLRNYLLAGGFLVIDDFWGSWQWANFEQQIRQVFPEHPIIDVPLDHPLFNTVYRIDEVLQVPAYGNYWGGRTWEQDGYTAHVRGIFDEQDRLMVLINWNTDLGDAWEWAERPEYPLKYSTFAVQLGINFIVYAMSH